MCLVPPAGPTVTAMTETRGAARREAGTRLISTVTTGSRKSGPLRVRALTVEAIYGLRPYMGSAEDRCQPPCRPAFLRLGNTQVATDLSREKVVDLPMPRYGGGLAVRGI